MSDFPQENTAPLFIHTYGRYMSGTNGLATGSGINAAPGSFSWGTGSLAYAIPFSLPFAYTVRRLFWTNGSTVGGNADIGIYAADFSQIYGQGSTVTSGASAVQYVTPATAILLPPDQYYLGITFSGTTNVVYGNSAYTANGGRMAGLYQMASALPLPSPFVPASFAQVGLPLCGITRTGSEM